MWRRANCELGSSVTSASVAAVRAWGPQTLRDRIRRRHERAAVARRRGSDGAHRRPTDAQAQDTLSGVTARLVGQTPEPPPPVSPGSGRYPSCLDAVASVELVLTRARRHRDTRNGRCTARFVLRSGVVIMIGWLSAASPSLNARRSGVRAPRETRGSRRHESRSWRISWRSSAPAFIRMAGADLFRGAGLRAHVPRRDALDSAMCRLWP